MERGLDPMSTNLVVADPERTDKTICLAITPPMKALGIKNRCRVFEIPKGVEYIMATPRMQYYLEYAARIYSIYLKYISKDDIHVYSIDEAFMDVSDYLAMYKMTARELGKTIMSDIYENTGITSSCGIGTNLFLTKIALDITAKHADDHIGELNEESYKRTLWDHRPLTDFWRIGRGTAARLEHLGIFTMRQIAESDPKLLYKTFGIDAELLIDHAWGRESCTMPDIKNYHSKTNCLSRGQVLMRDYAHDEGRLIVKEMADLLCLDLVDKDLYVQSITLYLGYSNALHVPGARGSISFEDPTSSAQQIIPALAALYDRIKDKNLSLRRVNISFNNVKPAEFMQYNLFTDPVKLEKENKVQKALISIKEKYGKNAILKGMNYEKGATTAERNEQIGGHRK